MTNVKYGQVSIDLRRASNADARLRERIVTQLSIHHPAGSDAEMVWWYRFFAKFYTQAVSAVGLPFALNRDASPDELVKAFIAYDNMDEAFSDALIPALTELSAPVEAATGPESLAEGAAPN